MALTPFWPPLHLAEVPLAPGSDEARQWAQDELAQQVYQDAKPGFAEQILALLQKVWDELINSVGAVDGTAGLAIAIGVVLLAVAVIIFFVRPQLNRRKSATAAVFENDHVMTAEQHRKLAQAAAHAADFSTALREQFRAIVRAAEERDVIVPALGRTAVEITADLERAFPAHKLALRHGADLFNAVRYGQVPPTSAMFAELVDTDQAVSATSPRYGEVFAAVQP
ncbi:DUF4129 domain-containing protein [Arthrobacter sp.]|uniref:DUF4129 domain-containing protein n=1 Tax=Arthrobacter sp. TaxID=1667 RepID=UPI0026E01938|nr:DUF4129 domain-containing protein [Arthrobacter sp.]MDO5751423.1 DUF4129 domain-containing protein [Arthrobacter sp.]